MSPTDLPTQMCVNLDDHFIANSTVMTSKLLDGALDALDELLTNIECSVINGSCTSTAVVPANLTSPSIAISCEEDCEPDIANRSVDRVALRCDSADSCSHSNVTLSNVEIDEVTILCVDASSCNALQLIARHSLICTLTLLCYAPYACDSLDRSLTLHPLRRVVVVEHAPR